MTLDVSNTFCLQRKTVLESLLGEVGVTLKFGFLLSRLVPIPPHLGVRGLITFWVELWYVFLLAAPNLVNKA